MAACDSAKASRMSEEQPVYLKYLSNGHPHRLRVGAFRFEGETQWRSKFGYVHLRKPSQFRTLLCKCGGNDWSDNGRFINEYECQSCGAFMEATEWRDDNGRAEVI